MGDGEAQLDCGAGGSAVCRDGRSNKPRVPGGRSECLRSVYIKYVYGDFGGFFFMMVMRVVSAVGLSLQPFHI